MQEPLTRRSVSHALLYVAAALPLWGAMHATPGAAPRAAPIRRATLAARNQYRPLCLEQLNKLL